jgi:hypothetical protein
MEQLGEPWQSEKAAPRFAPPLSTFRRAASCWLCRRLGQRALAACCQVTVLKPRAAAGVSSNVIYRPFAPVKSIPGSNPPAPSVPLLLSQPGAGWLCAFVGRPLDMGQPTIWGGAHPLERPMHRRGRRARGATDAGHTETRILQRAFQFCRSHLFLQGRVKCGVLRQNRRQVRPHGSALFPAL